MSGYANQDKPNEYHGRSLNKRRFIQPRAAALLLEQAKAKPNGAEAKMLLSAANDGWTIDFPKTETGLIPSYDDIVGQANKYYGESPQPLERAYHHLVMLSVGYDQIGDGK